jgi:hypothetical protein
MGITGIRFQEVIDLKEITLMLIETLEKSVGDFDLERV